MKKSEIENWPKVTLMVGKWPQDLDPDHLLQGGGGGGFQGNLDPQGKPGSLGAFRHRCMEWGGAGQAWPGGR